MSLTEIKQEIEEDISREIAIAGRIKKESNFDEPIEDLGDNDIDHDEINATIKSEEEQSNYNHDEEEDEDEPNDNINQCKVCKTIFSTRADLRKHHRVKGKKLDICCLCKKTFRLGGGALGIHQRIHTGAKPYECDVCKKKFSLRGNMVKHKISMHTDQRAFECDVCKKKFKQLAHLQQHKEVHSDSRPFQCDVCYTGYKTEKALRNHQDKHHEPIIDPKIIRCPICSKKFSYQPPNMWLKKHMTTHKDSLYCSTCFIVFDSLEQQAEHEHFKSVFAGAQNKCEFCNKIFTTDSNMKRHIAQHHNSSAKVFPCEFCTRCFKASDNYRRHLRVHTNYRPYVCDICNKGYTAISSLKEHKIRHTGKKPYGCAICKKFYPVSKLVKYHITKYHSEALEKCLIDNFIVIDYEHVDDKEMEVDVPIKTEPVDDPLGDFGEEEVAEPGNTVNQIYIKEEPPNTCL